MDDGDRHQRGGAKQRPGKELMTARDTSVVGQHSILDKELMTARDTSLFGFTAEYSMHGLMEERHDTSATAAAYDKTLRSARSD